MFRALPLTRVSLLFLSSEAQEAALLLARHGAFAPAADSAEPLLEPPGQEYRETWQEADTRLGKILEYCGEHAMATLPEEAIAPNLHELTGINARLREIWQACFGCHEEGLRMEEERKRLATLRETFARLRALDVDISRLLRRDGLLDARIGQVPAANLRRLGDAIKVAGYLLTVFDRAGDQAFAVVAGPRCRGEGQAECGLGGLLAQAGWRELPVPPELQTHPETAQRFLTEAAARLEAEAVRHCQVRNEHGTRHAVWLAQARLLLALARPFADASLGGLSGRGRLSLLSGWVPRRAMAELHDALEARFHGRYLIASREPDHAERGRIPSLLTYPGWLKPFVPLVRSYGVPRYGEIDPAPLFALTYVVLFGAMFGDVGHGAVLMILALLVGGGGKSVGAFSVGGDGKSVGAVGGGKSVGSVKGKGGLTWLRGVGLAAGASSILFGFLYGSVFGYEDLIHPLWQSPLHDPARMLLIAVTAGVGFIALTLAINIYNRLAAGRVAAALLDGGGLAGLIFYLAVARGLYALLPGGGFGVDNAVAAGAAFTLIAAWKWAETPARFGERLLVTLIESLETATNLFANTLSFLRVAAFSLNHVALALAVFALASGLDGVGHGVAIALGNAVIIVLEGGIVAIQALRLLYYEGFSRFFAGDGVEFAPLRLVTEADKA